MTEEKILKSGFPGGLTVLMSVYEKDSPVLFLSAVHSVYTNTVLPDCFLLVVDGAVPPALDEAISYVVTQYQIQTHRLPTNQGLCNALNSALPLIKTTWVARADADDLNKSDRFQRQLEAILANGMNVDLVGGAIQEIDRDGAPIAMRKMPLEHDQIINFSKRRNPFNHMTVIFRHSAVMKCGGYPNLHLKEDYGLWAILIVMGARVQNLPNVLVHATTGKDFYVRRGGLKSAMAEYDLQCLLYKLGLKSFVMAGIDFALRAGVFVLPPIFRQVVYKNFLRA